MNVRLVRQFFKVYAASRKQETSTLRNCVRLLGWALVGGLTWWQGELNPEQVAAVIMVSEGIAAAIGAFLPDQIKRTATNAKHDEIETDDGFISQRTFREALAERDHQLRDLDRRLHHDQHDMPTQTDAATRLNPESNDHIGWNG